MNTTGVMRENLALAPVDRKVRAEARALLLGLPFNFTERQQWLHAAEEITGGKKLSAMEFARAASLWLHARHTYSLRSQLPKSDGDPLVRWAMSKEPGHCELFAGAFTMLARAAGYPTRVVAGFTGGSWNGDYLIIRNSNAHAWCEINDGAGRWLRVDPTVPVSSDLPTDDATIETARRRIQPETGWNARIDRLRMLWYRRIINFERQDQMSLMKSLKDTTQASGKKLREWFNQIIKNVRGWLVSPWDVSRFLALGSVGAGLLAVIWVWRTAGRDWWLRWRMVHPGAVDPIRREAGRWLSRFASLPSRHGVIDTERRDIEDALQRLRYGRRENWLAPEQTFRRARIVFKKARRAADRLPH